MSESWPESKFFCLYRLSLFQKQNTLHYYNNLDEMALKIGLFLVTENFVDFLPRVRHKAINLHKRSRRRRTREESNARPAPVSFFFSNED